MEETRYIEQNKTAYNAIAKQFSDTREYMWDDLKLLSVYVKNGDTVLDVGCGNGRLTQLFAGTHVQYTGIDQSEELIKVAQAKYPDTKFLVGEMTKLDFPEETFDAVYCIAAFHHLPTDELRVRTLEEMKRVLKPSGVIVLLNWNLEAAFAKNKIEQGKWQHGEDHNHFVIPWRNDKGKTLGERHYWSITQERMKRLCGLAGLTVEEKFYTKHGKRTDRTSGENMVSVIGKK